MINSTRSDDKTFFLIHIWIWKNAQMKQNYLERLICLIIYAMIILVPPKTSFTADYQISKSIAFLFETSSSLLYTVGILDPKNKTIKFMRHTYSGRIKCPMSIMCPPPRLRLQDIIYIITVQFYKFLCADLKNTKIMVYNEIINTSNINYLSKLKRTTKIFFSSTNTSRSTVYRTVKPDRCTLKRSQVQLTSSVAN